MSRKWNYTLRSPGIRRAFRRAERIRNMPPIHWDAYISFKERQLIHKGGKP